MKKTNKVKHGFWNVAFIFAFVLTLSMFFGGVSAEASTPTIDVRVKADVPMHFTGTVTLNYVGMESEGFTVILTPDEEYSTVISVPQDLYTFKSQNVMDGYTIKASKNFTLENAELNTLYLLPIIVTEQTSLSNDYASYINVKIVAEPQNEIELKGSYDVSYSGTNGNSFMATLCEENQYTVEMPISKDLYTLKGTTVSTEFEGEFVLDTLYSFNCVDAKGEEKYILPVKVYSKENAPVKEEKEKRAVKEITVKAMLPADIDFAGTITATYKGDNNSSFEATLNAGNGYQESLYVYLDNYSLSYAVSYDTKVYSFTGLPSFTVTESTDYTEVPIYIMKDGVVLTDENFNVEEETEDEPPVEEPVEEKKGISPLFIFLILAVLGVVAYFIYIKFFKNAEDDEDYDYEDDEDDEALDSSEEEVHEFTDLD